MNSDLVHKKNELLLWISDLQDENMVSKLLEIKNNLNLPASINESKAEYAVKDDFEKRWEKGLTSEQSREETKRRIKEWWGK
ncbi:hypothetical protein [Epilithonimonas sp. UC225_85]|uniref:hypothetical protein n=1 Tax=Epilithonimonas sp. UC225_85 TaxID=3350167 RepID=UPI0036D38272